MFGAELLALILAMQAPQPPVFSDSRIQTIQYQENAVFEVEVAAGYQVIILLSPDEQIQSISLGDSASWQASPSKSGNGLFLKLVQSGFPTNMAVITNVRRYNFELIPLADGSKPSAYVLQFAFPRAEEAFSDPARAAIKESYKLSGTIALRPSLIGEDGAKTYIEWPANVDLPAIYALNDAGTEILVNGQMRGGQYVIDAVVARLVFRIDKKSAKATLIEAKER